MRVRSFKAREHFGIEKGIGIKMTNLKSQVLNLKSRRRSHDKRCSHSNGQLHSKGARLLLISFLLLSLLMVPTLAQDPFSGYRGGGYQRPTMIRPEATGPSFGEFTFIRTIYDSPNWGYGYRRGMGSWATDYPEADHNIIVGLREWAGTNLKIAARPEQIPIMDDRLFDYPIIYFVEPGFLELSDEQAARLREYVARGGFMYFDDFWGVYPDEVVR